MHSRIKIKFLLLVLVLVSGSTCNKWEAGFNAGGKSRVDLTLGAAATLARDAGGGFVVVGDGDAVLGANWQGEAYGGGYRAVNGKHHSVRGKAAGHLGGTIQPSIHTKVGRDQKGQWLREFQPNIEITTNAEFSYGGDVIDWDEADIVRVDKGDKGDNKAYYQTKSNKVSTRYKH